MASLFILSRICCIYGSVDASRNEGTAGFLMFAVGEDLLERHGQSIFIVIRLWFGIQVRLDRLARYGSKGDTGIQGISIPRFDLVHAM